MNRLPEGYSATLPRKRTPVMLSGRVGNYQYDPYGAVLIDQLWVTGPSGGPAGQAARERPTSAAQR
jgi:hypothetical protein